MSVVAPGPKSAPAGGTRTEKSAGGGAAGVEIAGFPQILFTRTFGDPDMLFVPLLDAARESFNTIERLCERGEKRESAVLLSGMQLASSLLRDSSFSLVARGLAHDNSYAVDLEQGTLLAQTRLFAVVSRRTSFFRVEITGKLNENLFSVRNPVQNTVIMQVEEERLRQPNFLFRDAGAGMPAYSDGAGAAEPYRGKHRRAVQSGDSSGSHGGRESSSGDSPSIGRRALVGYRRWSRSRAHCYTRAGIRRSAGICHSVDKGTV